MIEFEAIEFLDVWYWGGDVAYFSVTSSNNWTDEDGNAHLEGVAGDKRGPHKLFAGVVAGNSLLFENVSLPPTTTSPDRPRTTYSVAIFDENMKCRLSTVVGCWPLPDDLDPLTFANWSVQAAACGCCLDPVRYYNRAQVDFQIQEAIDNILLANMPTAAGLVQLVGGEAVVAEPLIAVFSRVHLTGQDDDVSGSLRCSARTDGVGFTITSSNPADSGYVAWSITEP